MAHGAIAMFHFLHRSKFYFIYLHPLDLPLERALHDLICLYLLSHCCYTVVTLLLHCCYTVVTLLLHCCYTVVTLLSLVLGLVKAPLAIDILGGFFAGLQHTTNALLEQSINCASTAHAQ
jgi:hypothetical protein